MTTFILSAQTNIHGHLLCSFVFIVEFDKDILDFIAELETIVLSILEPIVLIDELYDRVLSHMLTILLYLLPG